MLIECGIAGMMYGMLMKQKDGRGNPNNFPFGECDFWVEEVTDEDNIEEFGAGNILHVIIEVPEPMSKEGRACVAFRAMRDGSFGFIDQPHLNKKQLAALGF